MILKPRPVSLWLEPVEFGVLLVIILLAAAILLNVSNRRTLKRILYRLGPQF